MNTQALRILALVLGSLAIGAAWYVAFRGFPPRYAGMLVPDSLPLLVPMGLPLVLIVIAWSRWRFTLATVLVLASALPVLGFLGSIAAAALRCWLGIACEK
jgi:hypothetical protein